MCSIEGLFTNVLDSVCSRPQSAILRPKVQALRPQMERCSRQIPRKVQQADYAERTQGTGRARGAFGQDANDQAVEAERQQGLGFRVEVSYGGCREKVRP